MSETTHSNSARRRTRPDVARKRIDAFSRRFGLAHLHFAQHAAFPLALTPDLAYRLWANFQQNIRGEKLGISWIAVADLLLSSLCNAVGHELYEMDAVVREELLNDLLANPDFGSQRLHELSHFLLKETERQLESYDPTIRDLARTQQWTALAYVQPGDAAQRLAQALHASLEQQDKSEQLRLTSLIESFARPLADAGFTPLLTYARGVERLARGDIDGASIHMSQIATTETSTEFQGISLPIPQPVQEHNKMVAEQAPVSQPIQEQSTEKMSDTFVGQYFGNYKIIRLIEHGGLADVYLGEHKYLETQVAIKLSKYQLEKEVIEMFSREAKFLTRLRHSHIVQMLDFGVEKGGPFLVMDYVPNGTLRERYPIGTVLPYLKVLEYVQQIADALQYMHNNGIIHRDVNPTNMLIGEQDGILLSGFGLAMDIQYPSPYESAGTIAYMAPEQLEGHASAASDQYALGVVVYEWLCGSRPFEGPATQVVYQHHFTGPPSLREKVPNIPPEVEQVVFKSLEKDPARRFASIQAFARAFEQACQSSLTQPVVKQQEIKSFERDDPDNALIRADQITTTDMSLEVIKTGVTIKPDKSASEMQQQIYNFIVEYIQTRGMSPTRREIGQAMKIASTAHIDLHLAMLEEKGYIVREFMKRRGIKLTKRQFLPEFRPSLTTKLSIHSSSYEFVPHPVLPDEVQMIVRNRAIIYQLCRYPDRTFWALKVSNPDFRDPQAVQQTELLQQFRNLPGLQTAQRFCLTRTSCPELLSVYPALEFAILMPWIQGPTWAGFMDDTQLSTTYTMQQALELALTLAHTLWRMETNHLTHTDIAGDNVIVINPKRVELIDIDRLYMHGLPLPTQPNQGSRGYQHRNLDQRGNCRPEGDRYAGAILLTEILTWWNPLVRALIDGDSYFQLGEQESPDRLRQRLKAVRTTLRQIHPALRQMFLQVWNSADLAECPDFATWAQYLLQARSEL